MRVTFSQKVQLFPIFLIIRILWFIDNIGSIVIKSIFNIIRISMYLLVVTFALTSFYVETRDSGIANIPSVLTPESPSVLGVARDLSPLLTSDTPFPKISAVAVYAVDLITNTVLVDVNSDLKMAPASTTKLMTALVALDLYSLDEYISVPQFCTEIEGLKAGFYAKDSYSVRDLLFSLLVNSSADAACTLAIGKVSYTDFISLMNTKVGDIGLLNTSYSNPVGLDGENGSHQSTARDLYLLGRYAGKNKLIREIVATKEVTVTSTSGFSTYLVNTNDLLWTQPGSVGLKTGRTAAAGEVLVYEYDLDGKSIIIFIMHSENRFEDTVATLNWILDNYSFSD